MVVCWSLEARELLWRWMLWSSWSTQQVVWPVQLSLTLDLLLFVVFVVHLDTEVQGSRGRIQRNECCQTPTASSIVLVYLSGIAILIHFYLSGGFISGSPEGRWRTTWNRNRVFSCHLKQTCMSFIPTCITAQQWMIMITSFCTGVRSRKKE